MTSHYNLHPEQRRVQQLVAQFNADEQLWRSLEKTSSVSSAYLRMKARVTEERQLVWRVRRIEEALLKSKKRT